MITNVEKAALEYCETIEEPVPRYSIDYLQKLKEATILAFEAGAKWAEDKHKEHVPDCPEWKEKHKT